MENWKNFFGASVLGRGRDYYEDGAVLSLQLTERGYHALVEGRMDYEVEIRFRDNHISEMSCDCPYAGDGSYCKHMAAVLYEIEDHMHETGLSWKQELEEKRQEIFAVVKNMSTEKLQELVAGLAIENEPLRNRLLLCHAQEAGTSRIKLLKQEADMITHRYAGRRGFVDYGGAYGYFRDMERLLTEKVEDMVDAGHLMEAFEAANYVFCCVGHQDVDDSDGEGSMVADACYDLWSRILEECDDADEKKMLTWFQEHQSGYVNDYMEDYVRSFLLDELNDTSILQEEMDALDETIEKEMQNLKGTEGYSSCQRHILERIRLMEELDYSEKEIKGYRRKYRKFPAIREFEIQEYMEQGEYEKAETVLKESRNLDKKDLNRLKKYSEQLIKVYEKLEKPKEYQKELMDYVFGYHQGDLEFIKKLKGCCGETEWAQLREKMLTSSIMAWHLKYAFLAEEGMYGRMMQDIKANGSVHILDQYAYVLRAKYPKEVMDMYIRYVKNQVQRVSSRDAYAELMAYLKKIAICPGGKEEAQKLAQEWKQVYRRKPAMMDELRKAGF